MIFTKIWPGEGVPCPYPHAKLHGCGFKNVGLQAPKSVIFWYKFPLKGYIPLSVYKIWHGRGSPRSPPSCQISPLSLLNCGLTAPKIAKNCNFWYKFAPKGIFWGSTEKVEYRCRCTTTNLHLCNDTIIVLKITLLYSVSVISNFVIPKCDKKADRQKNTSHFFVYSRRATHDLHHTWRGDRGNPSHFCIPLNFLIRSVVSLLGAIENLWENAPTKGKC